MKISILKFCILFAFYFLLVLNFPLITGYLEIEKLIHFKDYLEFILVLFNILSILFLALFLISFTYLTKAFLIILLFLSSLSFYAITNYNVDLNNADLVRSFFTTTIIEASSFLTLKFFVTIFLTFILPTIFIAKSKIIYPKIHKFLLQKIILFILITCFTLSTFLNHQVYTSLAAETKTSDMIAKNFIPLNYLHGLKRYIKVSVKKNSKEKFITFNSSRIDIPKKENKKTIFIFILGESARAKNFSLNGYKRETNPLLKTQNIFNFSDFYSCGTITNVSLPCMFSSYERKNYSLDKYDHTENLLETIAKNNYKVEWYDNGMGSQGVTRNVKEIVLGDFYSSNFDEVLLKSMPTKQQLENDKNDLFLVLHQRGSHGPDYNNRYPKEFQKFLPICNNVTLKSCSTEAIINSYDNSILYTDYIINYTISYLKELGNESYQTAMLYASDHGESLGEYGLYMHGEPYFVAPIDQKHIPFILWFSDSMQQRKNIDEKCLRNKLKNSFSHDNIYHTVLDFLEIKSSSFKPDLSILTNCATSVT
ncbi:sulfatase-like hydrolase/transferase [Pigmentibacter sp. JX0631]|uniref:phosphoethanolamine transferase n=1 Tax=Pigmentibacter sp. JX0631 TaxID=2976982 RepID=UPI002469742D|nr:sulfatase-like hydrolase/transferase [Pigmentibacter sp. JX0631]WGL61275.1 sulfatase-like hydrolase/transferase [Pigmentibacter sp. JX0631]